MRFCSRCGFPLGGVAALLAAGGQLEPAGDGAKGALTPRQSGTRKGLLMVAGGLLFLKLAFVLTLFKEDFFVLLLPASLLLIAGVMRSLYGLLLESAAPRPKQLKSAKAAEADTRELGAAPAQTLPPASVADSTTRLLEKDEPALRPRK